MSTCMDLQSNLVSLLPKYRTNQQAVESQPFDCATSNPRRTECVDASHDIDELDGVNSVIEAVTRLPLRWIRAKKGWEFRSTLELARSKAASTRLYVNLP